MNIVSCAACQLPIHSKYMLKAVDQYWHENCLKCAMCKRRLGELDTKLYTRGNVLLCSKDYLKMFGKKTQCSACSQIVTPLEMVMKARDHVYHLPCFCCSACGCKFCVGDKFHIQNNKVLCEYDYQEQSIFREAALSNRGLHQITRTLEQLADVDMMEDGISKPVT